MNLKDDYFSLFSLSVSYDVDRKLLDSAYRKLQQQFHPDRAAGKSEMEKRIAMQTTAAINQAYSVLKSPLQRAQYLLQLQGLDSDQGSHITSDSGFLMEQILLREQLDEVAHSAEPFAALQRLRDTVTQSFQRMQQDFVAQYDQGCYQQAFDVVAKMQFFDKLARQIDELEQDLED